MPTLYKCYTNVLCLLGIAAGLVLLAAYCWPRPSRPYVCYLLGQRRRCWPVYPFCPSQYFILLVPACWWHSTGGHNALNQSWVNVGPPSVMLAHIQRGAKHDTVTQYTGLMLAQRHIRWANISPALGQCLVFDHTEDSQHRLRSTDEQTKVNQLHTYSMGMRKTQKNVF